MTRAIRVFSWVKCLVTAIIKILGMSELRIQVIRFVPVANRRVHLLRDHSISLSLSLSIILQVTQRWLGYLTTLFKQQL